MKILDVLKEIKKKHSESEFIPLGLPKLDALFDGGFLRQELVVIGGPTGSGKSFLACHLGKVASAAGFNTAIYSLEISSRTVVARIIGSEAEVKAAKILSGKMSEEEKERVKEATATVLARHSLLEVFDDKYTLKDIFADIKKRGVEVAIIDFIQNIIHPISDQYERLSRVSLEIQKMAKSLNVAMVVFSQLSNLMVREGAETTRLEYKGSGTIAQVADIGMVLFREGEIEDLAVNLPPIQHFILSVRKNRRGPSWQNVRLVMKFPGGSVYEEKEISAS